MPQLASQSFVVGLAVVLGLIIIALFFCVYQSFKTTIRHDEEDRLKMLEEYQKATDSLMMGSPPELIVTLSNPHETKDERIERLRRALLHRV